MDNHGYSASLGRTRARLAGLGSLALVLGLLASAVPAVASADGGTILNPGQTLRISWNDSSYAGGTSDCSSFNLTAGQVGWFFVLTKTTDYPLHETLTATFSDGTTVKDSNPTNPGGSDTLQWSVVTARISLTGASTDATGDNLNLSHICVGPPPTSNTATLTLVKSVDNALGGSATASDWTLTATLPGATTPTLSGAGGATGTVSTGTYTLAEAPTGASAPANYTEGSWTCKTATGASAGSGGQVTLQNGDNVTCTIVNTYTPPVVTCPANVNVLSVTQAAQYFDYTVSPGANTYPMVTVTITVKDGMTLPAGCEWTFSLNSYTTQGSTWATSGTQSLPDHQSTTLDSSKTSDTLTVKEPACFGQTDFYLGSNPYDGSSSNSPLPNYHNGVVVPPANVLIAYSNGGQACEAPPTLTLVKQLSDNAPAGDSAIAWALTATNTTRPSASISGATGDAAITDATVVPGTYTLSESGGPADASSYTAGGWSCQGATVSGDQVTLANGDNVTCTIVNTYHPTVLTLYKVICPSYTDVPANRQGAPDATGGHVSQLLTQSVGSFTYQISKTVPADAYPPNCALATSRWSFNVYAGDPGGAEPPTTWPVATVATTAGIATYTLTPQQVLQAENATSWESGIVVDEVAQPSVASFGELRCYTDIQNNDNLESIYNLSPADATSGITCVAYNVATPQQNTGSITFVKRIGTENQGPVAVGDFTLTYTNSSSQTLTAVNGDMKTVPYDSYRVGEQTPLPSNYTLDNVSCVPTGQEAPSTPTDVAAVNSDQPNWTCTVTNDYSYTPPPAVCTVNCGPVVAPAPTIGITKLPATQSVVSGGTATWSIVVTNTGNVALTNVKVADPIAPNCVKTFSGSLEPGASEATYTCTLANVTKGFTNVATAYGTYGTTTVQSSASAKVKVTPGGVLGATGTPSLPPTTSLPGQGGAPNGTILLLLGMLGAASLALITATLLRERLLDSVEK